MVRLSAMLFALAMVLLPVRLCMADEINIFGQEVRYEVPVYADTACIAYSPDGKYIATGCRDRIEFFDAATGEKLSEFVTGGGRHFEPLSSLAYSQDGKHLAVCKGRDEWDLYDLEDYNVETAEGAIKTIISRTMEPLIPNVALSPNGHLIAAGSNRKITFYDDDSEEEICSLDYEHDDPDISLRERDRIFSVSFSNDGSMLAVGLERQIDIWDSVSGNLLTTLDGAGFGSSHRSYNKVLIFSPDDSKLYSYCNDCTTTKWDIENNSPIWNVVNGNKNNLETGWLKNGHGCNICHMPSAPKSNRHFLIYFEEYARRNNRSFHKTFSISSDGNFIAAVGLDGSVVIRNAETGRRIRTIPCIDVVFTIPDLFLPYRANSNWRGGEWISDVKFSPDGKSVAVVVDRPQRATLSVYNVDKENDSPLSNLNNDIQDLIEERDTKINLAYSSMPISDARAEDARLTKEYDLLIEARKKKYEADEGQPPPPEVEVPPKDGLGLWPKQIW